MFHEDRTCAINLCKKMYFGQRFAVPAQTQNSYSERTEMVEESHRILQWIRTAQITADSLRTIILTYIC